MRSGESQSARSTSRNQILPSALSIRRADGIAIRTPRGLVRALTAAAFERRYAGAQPPSLDRGPRFAGCRIAVEDLPALRARLSAKGIGFLEAQGALVIPPAEGFGLALGFVQRSKP